VESCSLVLENICYNLYVVSASFFSCACLVVETPDLCPWRSGFSCVSLPSPSKHFLLLRSILLRVSSLSTGEDVQTNQVRDEYVFFVTETLRVSVHTAALPSVPSRFNLKTAMLPVGAVHRRTRRTVGLLTGGSGVDMKDERHNCCAPHHSTVVSSWFWG
jgi:hypothetical protein